MKRLALIGFLMISIGLWGQTTSLATGNWSDPSIWSTGVVPPATATVNVNHTVSIDQNILVTTGTFNFGVSDAGGECDGTPTADESITDIAGGTAHTLTALTSGGTLNFKDGITTFEGGAAFDNCTINIDCGATLVLGIYGGTTNILDTNNGTTFNVNGTLIINGNFINNNNGSGLLSIGDGGLVQVNGNYDASFQGAVDIAGNGDLFTTGYIKTQGSSDVFGSTNDCNTGPCSGRNLCGYTLNISPNQVICNSTSVQYLASPTPPAPLTITTSATGPFTYTWQRNASAAGFGNNVSGKSATGSLADLPRTNSTYTIAPTRYDAGETYYYRVYMYDDATACGAFSPAVNFVSVADGGWLGTTNDWHTNSNWCDNSFPTTTSPNPVIIDAFPTGSGKFQPIISTADANARALTIGSGASVTINGSRTLNMYGNMILNGDLLSSSSATVALVATNRTQTISGSAFTTFNNLTINNTFGTLPNIIFSTNNRAVYGALTLTNGFVNLGGYTLTVGSSASSTGSLTRAAGWFYGGFLQRYFGTGATSLANGLFPLGLSTTDYRPFSVSHTGLTTQGGYVRVSHSGAQYGSVNTSFNDAAIPVLRRSTSSWTSVTNGISTTGSPISIEAGGTSLSFNATNAHFRLVLVGGVVGTNGGATGVVTPGLVDPRILRTGLTPAQLSNTFYVGTTNLATPLPITLSNFNAALTKEGVELSWTTLTEENADFFQIEKSTNGYDFNNIGQVKANGSSVTKIDYAFLDKNTNFNKAYYRLRNVDIGGVFTYSNIVSVERQGFNNTGVLVYPNPVVSNRLVNIVVGDGSPVSGIVSLCDLSGKTMSYEQRANVQGEYKISEDIKVGFYLLKVQTKNNRQSVKVVIKD
jgi:hypothetical protein